MMKRVALALSCATVALALRPVPPPPRAVQSKAAKKVAAGMAAAVLAGASTLPLSSLALSADDYDAIYGMSATGSKGSSIKFEMPSFGGDDASDTSAADKKKADDAAKAKEADAAAKAAEREAAREARAKQQQELRDAAKKREEEAQAKKDAALAKAKAAVARLRDEQGLLRDYVDEKDLPIPVILEAVAAFATKLVKARERAVDART